MTPERSLRPKHKVIGVIEEVKVRGPGGEIQVRAKIDTGAARTSLDTDLAKRLGLGPVLGQVRIRAAAAERPERRDVVAATLEIAGRSFDVRVAVTDRKDMQYHMIVGMDILSVSGFLVNPRRGAGLGKGRPVVKADP
jgi:hypothetical protein